MFHFTLLVDSEMEKFPLVTSFLYILTEAIFQVLRAAASHSLQPLPQLSSNIREYKKAVKDLTN